MIIEFNKKPNFYDDFKRDLSENDIVYQYRINFTPIRIYEQNYILTISKNVEGYLMDYRSGIEIIIYIMNADGNCEKIIKKIDNIMVLGSDFNNSNNSVLNIHDYDCYIDPINNILLIRFEHSNLNYIDINPNLDLETDLRKSNEKIKLKYVWFDNEMNERTLEKTTNISNIWMDAYINLPHIPRMLDKSNLNLNQNMDQIYPCTGSVVYDERNNLLGVVSNIDTNLIYIIPILCIKKLCDYLLGYNVLFLGLDIYPINFDLRSGLNNVEFLHGLLITNNYYNNVINEKKNFFENDEKNLKSNFSNINRTVTEEYKNFKKGNIICSVDGYKINSNGNIYIDLNDETTNLTNTTNITNTTKSIPLKSYIWLFKNSNNNILNIKSIPPSVFNNDLVKKYIKKGEFTVNNSHIKKQINVINSIIPITTNFNAISLFSINDLKYIKYKKITLVELNEKFLQILNAHLDLRQNQYYQIISNLISNQYTNKNQKKILIFDFNKKLPTIKIINNNVNNFDDLLNKYESKKEKKNFLLSNV